LKAPLLAAVARKVSLVFENSKLPCWKEACPERLDEKKKKPRHDDVCTGLSSQKPKRRRQSQVSALPWRGRKLPPVLK
jgi:hypothetical protein